MTPGFTAESALAPRLEVQRVYPTNAGDPRMIIAQQMSNLTGYDGGAEAPATCTCPCCQTISGPTGPKQVCC
jgi:hypothetical protein